MEEQGPDQDSAIELLSFTIGGQDFAAQITSVREIRSWTRATPLPHAPDYMAGVINLRGTVLPILNLARRLGMEADDGQERRVVIVVEIGGEALGLLVDGVSDIVAVAAENLAAPPELASDQAARFLSGLALLDDKMLRVLDLSSVPPDSDAEAA